MADKCTCWLVPKKAAAVPPLRIDSRQTRRPWTEDERSKTNQNRSDKFRSAPETNDRILVKLQILRRNQEMQVRGKGDGEASSKPVLFRVQTPSQTGNGYHVSGAWLKNLCWLTGGLSACLLLSVACPAQIKRSLSLVPGLGLAAV